MKEIAGCQIVETLYRGRCSEIYRGAKDNQTYIIKVPSTPVAETKLVHEFHIGQRISSEYVVKFLELKLDGIYGHILIEEDDRADTLLHVIPTEGFLTLTFLSIATQLAEGLQHIHESNVIHKDIKPANIIMKPDSGKIKYIDFNSASILRNNQPSMLPHPTATTEATLAYISPELTGRINRRMDYRTDFYSLGVTFYHLLCGRLPFTVKNVAELVHCHLAKQPTPPHELRPSVPKIVSEIIMKLMQKCADLRYQSACGLLADLRRCLDEFCGTNEIHAFELAKEDIPEYFCITGTLYGRSTEISILSQACERVCQGSTEVALISGATGSGKSALVQELLPVIASKGGFFLMGKYEALRTHHPYNAIVQALQSWVQQILAGGIEEIDAWKTKLLDQLGTQGQLIVDILPELELIIGQQTPSPILDSEQSKMRFQLVFERFLATVATQETPVVLFLDDLHWSDSASLALLQSVFSHRDIKYLLLVGTYRNGEQEDLTSIIQTANVIQKAGIPIQTVSLQALSLSSVNQWAANTMRTTPEEALPLSAIIYQKTAGYPFYVRVFMQTLYDQGFLTQAAGRWRWSLEEIRGLPVTENLIGFLVQQIEMLSPETQEVFQFVSCVGHRFSLEKLSEFMGRPQSGLQNELNILVEKGLLLQNEESYWFSHDKVQEAVLGQIPKRRRIENYLRIGRILKIDPKQLPEAVDILNRGRELITDENEFLELAKLNLQVGKKSKQGAAYQCALCYFNTAQTCLTNMDIWKRDYQFAIQLYKELADMEHLNMHYELSTKYSELILQNAQDLLEKLEIYRLKVGHLTVRGVYGDAIQTGIEALKLLHIEFDLEHVEEICEPELNRIKEKVSQMDYQARLEAPKMKSSNTKMAMQIIDCMLVPSYFVNQVLHDYLVALMVDLTLTHGNAEESSIAFVTFAMLLVHRWDQIDQGNRLGLMALKMSEQTHCPINIGRTYGIYAGFVHHWKQSLDLVEPYLNRALQAVEEAGDYQYAGYNIAFKALFSFYLPVPLSTLEKQVSAYIQLPYTRTNAIVQAQLEGLMLVVTNLTGQTTAPTLFNYKGQSDHEYLLKWKQQKQMGMLFNYLICKVEALFIHQEVGNAISTIAEAENYVGVIPGVVCVPYHYLYSSLVMLALYSNAPSDIQTLYLGKLEIYETQLKHLADTCPENYLHKVLLVQAEKSRVLTQDRWATADLYEQALQAVQKNGAYKDQAIANELAAIFFLNSNKPSIARGLLQTAFHFYEKWGAKKKVNLMLRQNAELLKPTGPNLSSFSISGEDETISANSLRLLDLTAILKTSQAISCEVDLRSLLVKTLNILMASAGAQRGTFFVVESDDIYVQAEYTADGVVQTLQRVPLSRWEGGAKAIVDFAKRTRQPVLLSNASTDRRFAQDNYIKSKCIQSVLCSPILRHEQIKAILYLENNLAPHVFSEQHMQTLTLLGVQIAISLENAGYYNSVNSLNERLNMALHSGNVGTWTWNIETNKTTWDEHMFRIFGLTKEEFDGEYSSFLSCLQPEDVDMMKRSVKQVLVDRSSFNLEYRIIRKSDKAQRFLETFGKVICGEHGQPELMLGAVRDITQRKMLEQERLQALSDAEEKERKRAEEAEKYRTNLENFINQICHEIRNPMCGIFGNVDIAQITLVAVKNCIGNLPENSREFLNDSWQKLEECMAQIQQCVKHQKAIVDDVLDLSKLESSQACLAAIPFSLKSVIREVAQMFAAPIALKNLSMLVSMPDTDHWVYGDPRRLKIALTNIVANAVKFTQTGSIKISLKVLEFSRAEVQFAIDVEDTGIGMTSEEQSHLFQRFACVAAAQFEGSGLGLYISKRFVECMGGKIEVESTKGLGSKFSIQLRLKAATGEGGRDTYHSPEAPPSSPAKRILVVEDNEVNQKILRRQLEQAGHHCEVAGNGQEALDKWMNDSPPFDMIFMDVEMPIMGGFEATQLIRKREAEKGDQKIPIVGLSAYASLDFVQQAQAVGMDDYITKPYEKKSIYHAVALCCEKESKKRASEDLPILSLDESPCKCVRSK